MKLKNRFSHIRPGTHNQLLCANAKLRRVFTRNAVFCCRRIAEMKNFYSDTNFLQICCNSF